MHDEAIHRCIETACARLMPRRVNYCPYCGATQQAAGQAHAAPAHAANDSGPADAAPDPAPAAIRIPRPAAPSARPVRTDPAPAPISPEWGASGGAARPGAHGAAAAPSAPAGATAGRPAALQRAPQREPIRLRWWLLALAGLWVVWFMAKPAPKQLANRIDHAIALAVQCRPREAQSELIALRSTRATQEQLQRVEDALNDAAAECRRQRQRQRNKSLGDSGALREHRLASDEA